MQLHKKLWDESLVILWDVDKTSMLSEWVLKRRRLSEKDDAL